jgi:diacylglycerol kinase (ATP)
MIPSGSGKKKVAVILNGICRKKKFFYRSILPALSGLCDVGVFETRTKNDAELLASEAARQHADVVLAAGGDGTLNQVVNGVLRGRESETKLPVIGLIPVGSGNDFARTAGVKADAWQLGELFARFAPKKIDVGQIQFTALNSHQEMATDVRYFVNVADIGMGPMVVDKVQKNGRAFGHGIAYYRSILSTFISYRPMVVRAVTKEWRWEGRLRTLGVANGKCYGHGLYIAPDAVPDDRKFSVFICGNVSVFDFIKHTGALKAGRHILLPEIHYKETTSIELSSERPCLIEGDGEILGQLPAHVSLTKRQLDFLI